MLPSSNRRRRPRISPQRCKQPRLDMTANIGMFSRTASPTPATSASRCFPPRTDGEEPFFQGPLRLQDAGLLGPGCNDRHALGRPPRTATSRTSCATAAWAGS
eukprot:15698587-Heterocapsa_arctica.AAC.1